MDSLGSASLEFLDEQGDGDGADAGEGGKAHRRKDAKGPMASGPVQHFAAPSAGVLAVLDGDDAVDQHKLDPGGRSIGSS